MFSLHSTGQRLRDESHGKSRLVRNFSEKIKCWPAVCYFLCPSIVVHRVCEQRLYGCGKVG